MIIGHNIAKLSSRIQLKQKNLNNGSYINLQKENHFDSVHFRGQSEEYKRLVEEGKIPELIIAQKYDPVAIFKTLSEFKGKDPEKYSTSVSKCYQFLQDTGPINAYYNFYRLMIYQHSIDEIKRLKKKSKITNNILIDTVFQALGDKYLEKAKWILEGIPGKQIPHESSASCLVKSINASKTALKLLNEHLFSIPCKKSERIDTLLRAGEGLILLQEEPEVSPELKAKLLKQGCDFYMVAINDIKSLYEYEQTDQQKPKQSPYLIPTLIHESLVALHGLTYIYNQIGSKDDANEIRKYIKLVEKSYENNNFNPSIICVAPKEYSGLDKEIFEPITL